MNDLADFLLARLADDEAIARAAIDDDEHWLHVGGGEIIQGDAGFTVSSGYVELPRRYEAAPHITRWDPARVLAECEAKRRTLDWAFENAARIDGEWGCCHSPEQIRAGLCERDGAEAAESLLRLLAVPYVDHPDFRPEWRPTD